MIRPEAKDMATKKDKVNHYYDFSVEQGMTRGADCDQTL